LKELLEDSEFPLGRLVLLETEEYAGLLQEFAGDIRITQIVSPDAFDDVDIAFFACSPEIIESYAASGSPFPELTIDLTQTGREGTLFLSGVSDARVLKPTGYFINPHPAAIVLARVLARLHRAFGVQSSRVTILEPASERGVNGVDELQEQTVSLLNFQQLGSRVFKGQLAFNLLPEVASSQRKEQLLGTQLRRLLQSEIPMPGAMIVQAPVFHSHAFSLFVDLISQPAIEEVIADLQNAAGIVLHLEDDATSPVSVIGTDNIHIGRLAADRNFAGSFTFWLVADNLRLAAANAIQTAEHIMFAPAF
jgi:aspartate-semialdehyde dehydrogenase